MSKLKVKQGESLKLAENKSVEDPSDNAKDKNKKNKYIWGIIGLLGGIVLSLITFLTGLVVYIDKNDLEITEKVEDIEVLDPQEIYTIEITDYQQDMYGDILLSYSLDEKLSERCKEDYCKLGTIIQKEEGYSEKDGGPFEIIDEDFDNDGEIKVVKQAIFGLDSDDLPKTFLVKIDVSIYDGLTADFEGEVESALFRVDYEG